MGFPVCHVESLSSPVMTGEMEPLSTLGSASRSSTNIEVAEKEDKAHIQVETHSQYCAPENARNSYPRGRVLTMTSDYLFDQERARNYEQALEFFLVTLRRYPWLVHINSETHRDHKDIAGALQLRCTENRPVPDIDRSQHHGVQSVFIEETPVAVNNENLNYPFANAQRSDSNTVCTSEVCVHLEREEPQPGACPVDNRAAVEDSHRPIKDGGKENGEVKLETPAVGFPTNAAEGGGNPNGANRPVTDHEDTCALKERSGHFEDDSQESAELEYSPPICNELDDVDKTELEEQNEVENVLKLSEEQSDEECSNDHEQNLERNDSHENGKLVSPFTSTESKRILSPEHTEAGLKKAGTPPNPELLQGLTLQEEGTRVGGLDAVSLKRKQKFPLQDIINTNPVSEQKSAKRDTEQRSNIHILKGKSETTPGRFVAVVRPMQSQEETAEPTQADNSRRLWQNGLPPPPGMFNPCDPSSQLNRMPILLNPTHQAVPGPFNFPTASMIPPLLATPPWPFPISQLPLPLPAPSLEGISPRQFLPLPGLTSSATSTHQGSFTSSGNPSTLPYPLYPVPLPQPLLPQRVMLAPPLCPHPPFSPSTTPTTPEIAYQIASPTSNSFGSPLAFQPTSLSVPGCRPCTPQPFYQSRSSDDSFDNENQSSEYESSTSSYKTGQKARRFINKKAKENKSVKVMISDVCKAAEDRLNV